MKYLLLLLFPCPIFSQDAATEFANKVFNACKENDIKKLEQFMASQAEINTFVTGLDLSVNHERMLEIYEEYKQKVIKRFTLLQEIAAKHKLDFSTAIINKTEVDARPVELRVDDGSKEEVNLTKVKIFFRCSGEYLCFMVSDAIQINGRYYLSNEAAQLHRVN